MWRHAPELQPLVRARSPFRVKATREFDDVLGSAAEWDIERLSTLVADMEAGERAVPVLIRQYLRLGGRFVSFNVDARFSNTLDGLIVVDLLRTHRRMLERYLGREGAAAYLAAAAPGAERVGAPTKAAVTPVPT
jgi:hypothetical protein